MKFLIVLAVLAICVTSSYFLWTCNHKKLSKFDLKQDEKQIQSIRQVKEQDTTNHSIIKGVVVAQKTVAVGSLRQIKSYYGSEIKNREKQLNLSGNEHISNVLSFKAEVKDSMMIESDYSLHFPISTKCSKGTIKVSKDLKSLTLIEETNIHIAGTIYWKKKRNFTDLTHFRIRSWLVGNVVTKQYISSDCPNVKIDSISSIQIIKQ